MAKDFHLVTRGKPVATIYLSRLAPEPVRFAASELQRYVQQMSGALLPIQQVTGPIHQLTIAQTPKEAMPSPAKQASAKERQASNAESYQISVTPTSLTVAGAGATAVLCGVYDCLERLGCGFCVPGEDTVPHRSTVSLSPCEVTASPAFTYRAQVEFPLRSLRQTEALIDWLAKNRFNWYHAAPNSHGLPVRDSDASNPTPELLPEARGYPGLWLERQEMVFAELKKRGLHLQFGGHTMHTWMPRDEYFEQHPEWYALINGERGGDEGSQKGALCVTNAAMRAEMVRNMRRFLDENPAVAILDLWHPDTDDFCRCVECLHGMTEEDGTEFIGMAYVKSFAELSNFLAEELQKSHPGVMVSPLVNYSSSTNWPMPHGSTTNEHVLVGLAHFPPLRDSYRPLAGEPKSPGNERLLGIDLTWSSGARHTYIYEYYSSWYQPFIHPQALLAAQDIRLLKRLGFDGLSSDMYGWTPVNLYVVARLMWNPELPAEELVKDFCTRYYGEAAEAMYEHWMELERSAYGIEGYLSSSHIMKLCKKQRRRQLTSLKAIRDRTTDSVVRSRIERCMLPWQHLGDKEKARWWALPDFDETSL